MVGPKRKTESQAHKPKIKINVASRVATTEHAPSRARGRRNGRAGRGRLHLWVVARLWAGERVGGGEVLDHLT